MRGKGKNYTLKTTYPKVKFKTSTEDRTTLKAFTYEVRFWFDKSNTEDPKKELNDLFKKTTKVLREEAKYHFDTEKFIGVKDIPNDVENAVSNVFTLFEFTLFAKHKLVNDIHINTVFSDITRVVYETVYEHRDEITASKQG